MGMSCCTFNQDGPDEFIVVDAAIPKVDQNHQAAGSAASAAVPERGPPGHRPSSLPSGLAAKAGDTAADAWRRHALGVVQTGAADLFAGLGDVFVSLYQQRHVASDAVLTFMFQDKLTETAPSSPVANSTQCGRLLLDSPFRTLSAWSLGGREIESSFPRSLRLSQRTGKMLETSGGCETIASCAVTALPLITDKVMACGELEALMTRTSSSVALGKVGASASPAAEDSLSEPTVTPSTPSRSSASVLDFGMAVQVSAVPWLFRALVNASLNGPLSGLVDQGLSGDEALQGLARVWPQLTAFLRTVVDMPAVHLSAERSSMGCMKVVLCVPLDFQAIAAGYPSASRLLRILRSLRVRFTDRPLSRPSCDAPQQSGVRQVGLLTYEDGEMLIHFTLHGRHVAWVDMDGQPIVEDGKVAVLEEPISTPEAPEVKELSLFLCYDNLRLRLSDFGCIGLSSLPLPEITLRFGVTTVPLDNPQDGQGGGEADAKEGGVAVDMVFRIVGMGAFPAEQFVRPLFNVRLMRSLLERTFEMSWSLRPCSNGFDWQLLHVIRASFPKVARTFRMCLKAFVQKQVRESDWLRLFGNLLSAFALDLRSIEDSMLSASRLALPSP